MRKTLFSQKGRKQTRAIVTGAGGFIGHHFVSYLKSRGYWVRGVDQCLPHYSPTKADEFLLRDLRNEKECREVLELHRSEQFDEVYHFAANMGVMGFISEAECEIMRNSALMNLHMPHHASELGIPRYFLSSSVCVYRDMQIGEPELREEAAYPAGPDNEYGWEKLYAERVAMTIGRRRKRIVRIARFENCYGQQGARRGGRENLRFTLARREQLSLLDFQNARCHVVHPAGVSFRHSE